MIYCHECGSEVAESDAFCPYCGITLVKPETPVEMPPEAPPAAVEEFDSTIVMTPAEFAAEKAAFSETVSSDVDSPVVEEPEPASAENDIVEPVEADETLTADAVRVPEAPEEESAEPTVEASSEPELVDDIDIDSVQTPGVIADLEKSLVDARVEEEPAEIEPIAETAEPDEIEVSPEVSEPAEEPFIHVGEESVVESEIEAVELPAEENIVEDIDISESVVEAVSESSAEIAEEPAEVYADPFGEPESPIEVSAASDEVESTPEPEWDSIARSDEEPASDEIESEPAETQADIEPEPVHSTADDLQKPETTVEDVADTSSDELSDAGIGMPADADALDASDPYLQASQFDSVRIVDQEAFKPDPADANRFVDPVAHGATTGESESASSGEVSGRTDQTEKKAAKLTPLKEGTVLLNRYEIVRKIGGGGMGAVYLASDNNLGGVVRAVKEMVQAHIAEDQQQKAIEDFKRESMILSSLDHVSIPTIFDYFYDENEGRFYLVMKYISGGDLAGRLRASPEGKIDELTVTGWALQITDVLDYLHSQPSTIVYRDLKPSNIMIDGNSGRIMLIDFGIARSINQKEEKGVTAVGTMGYAPPELFSGKVEPRSDIYSLGSTMFHLLTGADPQSNPLLIFDFQKNPRPRQINPQLSDQIETILMRSVEYNADARFASAAEMRSVLEEHIENLKAGRVTYGVSEAPASVSLANQSVFCGFCGQNIVATDLFCAFCGAKQPIAQHGVHSEIYSVESHPAKLVIRASADLQGSNYTLIKPENLIGRRDPMSNIFPEIDLTKYDPQTKISRRHAKVWNDGSKYYVEDLGSSNGTVLTPLTGEFLRLAPHRPHPIMNGDMIKIGDTTLHFVVS
jgi:serine/threonine-protein kinase